MSDSNDYTNYPPVVDNITATIASSGTKSSVIDLRGLTLCGIETPAALDGSNLSFERADASDGTFVAIYRNGADRSEPIAASKYIDFDPSVFAGVQFLKIVSDTTETSDREFKLSVRPV